KLAASRGRLSERLTRIEALSPLAVLGRGYAIARDLEGKVITDAAALSEGERVNVRLRQGQFMASVEAREPEKELQGS
ncbi:MAG TPA: exodeoxyribonuclease VII large subunit, partial [Polyangiaceae bacterium]